MDFQEELVKYTFERLQGSHDLDKILHASKGKPSSQYLLGNLASQKGEDDSGPDGTGRASIRAGRLRVSVPLESNPNNNSKAKITVNGSVFFQGKDSRNEKIWHREDFSIIEQMHIAEDSKSLDFTSLFEKINTRNIKK